METTDVVDKVDPVDLSNQTDQTDQTDQEVDDLGGDLLGDEHTEGDIHNQSIPVHTGFAPNTDIRNLEDEVSDGFGIQEDRIIRVEKLDILEKVFRFRPNIAHGRSSEILLTEGRGLELNIGSDGRVINGLKFGGKIVIKFQSKKVGYVFSTAEESVDAVEGLKKLMKKVEKEFKENSNRAYTRRAVNSATSKPSEGSENIEMGDITSDPGASTSSDGAAESFATDAVVDEVLKNTKEELADMIRTGREDIRLEMTTLNFPKDHFRQIMGVLELKILTQEGELLEIGIKSYKKNIEFFDKLAEDAKPESREEALYKDASRVSSLALDFIRMREDLKPESEEVQSVVEEEIEKSDELRLERFKRWAKENIAGISAVAISAAGLITGIIVAARGAMKAVAGGVGKFAGALARVLKKLGPVFAAIGSLVSTALSWGAKGILWMANNLWFLAIMIAAALYAEYGRRRSIK